MTTFDTNIDLASPRTRAEATGSELGEAIRAVLNSSERPITNASELTRVTGLNRNSASRIMMAIGKRDALATLLALPGPEALRKLVGGLDLATVSAPALEALRDALGRYERLVTREFDGRPALEAAIARWMPEARARVEATSRHLVFRGMAAIRGISVDTSLQTLVVTPSRTDPQGADLMLVFGSIGLRRLIPGAPIRLVAVNTNAQATRYETVDGREMTRLPVDGMLPEYSSRPLPHMHEDRTENNTQYAIHDDALGLNQALDLVYCQVGLGQARVAPQPGRNRLAHSLTVVRPTRELVLDTFLHRDVWPGIEPRCMVYDTSSFGAAKPGDPAREIDLIPQELTLTGLGTGLKSVATPSVPNYSRLLHDLFERRGYDPLLFRGYRLSVTYPIYAGQHAMLLQGPHEG